MNYIKVKDVTEFVRNGASIKQDKQCTIGIPITRIETISNSQFNWDKVGYANIIDDKYKDYYLEDKDVLLSHINSAKFLGRSVLFEKKDSNPIIHGMNLLCLRFRQEEYLPSFFVWYSKSLVANNYFTENTKKAVNQASITSSAIKEMPIPNLLISEQLDITNHLDSIQAAIDNKQQQLKELDELVTSRFIELFDIYTETTKLHDVATVSGGLTKNAKRDKLPLRMPYLRVAIWQNEIVPCVHQNHLIKSRFDSGLVIPTFAMYYFMTPQGREQIRSKAVSTSGLYTLSVSKISDLTIPLPPLSLQNEFASFVQQIDKSKFVVKQQIKDLQELMDSKMQEYFGE